MGLWRKTRGNPRVKQTGPAEAGPFQLNGENHHALYGPLDDEKPERKDGPYSRFYHGSKNMPGRMPAKGRGLLCGIGPAWHALAKGFARRTRRRMARVCGTRGGF